jgi:hypothetical protein
MILGTLQVSKCTFVPPINERREVVMDTRFSLEHNMPCITDQMPIT